MFQVRFIMSHIKSPASGTGENRKLLKISDFRFCFIHFTMHLPHICTDNFAGDFLAREFKIISKTLRSWPRLV